MELPSSDNNSPPTPIMALQRFQQIYAEHQAMVATIGLLLDEFPVPAKTPHRVEKMIEKILRAKKLACGLRESKTWLRAIALQHPETKKLVTEALADLREYEE